MTNTRIYEQQITKHMVQGTDSLVFVIRSGLPPHGSKETSEFVSRLASCVLSLLFVDVCRLLFLQDCKEKTGKTAKKGVKKAMYQEKDHSNKQFQSCKDWGLRVVRVRASSTNKNIEHITVIAVFVF